jgi:LAS superfamily LD-carboxypeptidase LdcB
VTRIDSEISDLDELLLKSMEKAEARTQETSIDANTTTKISELTPQATLDADITGQVGRYHASQDEFIPIDRVFEEVHGIDDKDLVTNDLTVQDARAADQAFATTSSTDQNVTEEILNVSGNEIHEDVTNTLVVSGKLACHPTATDS